MPRAHPQSIDDLSVPAADPTEPNGCVLNPAHRAGRARVIDLRPIASRGTHRLGPSIPKFGVELDSTPELCGGNR